MVIVVLALSVKQFISPEEFLLTEKTRLDIISPDEITILDMFQSSMNEAGLNCTCLTV